MMRRFIGFQYDTEIKNLSLAEVTDEWKKEHDKLKWELSQQKGIYAEVHVGAVMRCFDGRNVDGTIYFNLPAIITLPKFERMEQRGGVVDKGIMVEIDLVGEWVRLLDAPEMAQEEAMPEEPQISKKEKVAWLVQVRYTTAAMDSTEIKKFIKQVEVMKAKVGYAEVVSWYVCKGGFTENAQNLLKKEGVLFSNREQFNKLANLFDFFGFPA